MEQNIRQVLRLRLSPQRKLAIIRRLLATVSGPKPQNVQVQKLQVRPFQSFQQAHFGFTISPRRFLRQQPNQKEKRKRGLLVGSNYPGTPYPLQGCLNDVNFMRDKLISLAYTPVTLLSDGSQTKPTRGNVINNFLNLLSSSKPGDTLFFGYSGHGSYTFDRSGDEKDRQDEAVVCCDMNYISDDEFKQIIDQNLKPNTKLFCIMDACHSGSLLDLKYQWLDSSNMEKLTINNKQKETKGQVILISGCMDSQTSADAYINSTYRGAMLWSFLQVFDKNPKISYKDLIASMRSVLKTSKFSQTPQLSSGQNLDINSNLFL